MRYAHFLRKNKGNRLPDRLIVFDTETDSIPIADNAIEARLRFGWYAASWRRFGTTWTAPNWTRFDTPSLFWDDIESLTYIKRRVMLASHNLGFDFKVVDGFTQLQSRGWTLHRAIIDDPPTILQYRNGSRSLLIVDTLNWWRMSLASLGADLGLPKLDMPDGSTDSDLWDTYCRRDVEIIFTAITQWMQRVRDWDLGNFSLTLPSQAFTAWRHRHLHTKVLIDSNPKALSLARAAYMGGRSEAFYIGSVDGSVDVYDVTSMYPSVMRHTPMPTILEGVFSRLSVSDLQKLIEAHSVIADVEIHTETADYPLRSEGHLIFPIGHYRTTLALPELQHALARDRVVKVNSAAIYSTAVLFDTYVDEWYSRRAEYLAAGDTANVAFCKLMLNSLYGKFGQSGFIWETIGESDPNLVKSWIVYDHETKQLHRFRSLAGILQERANEQESRESHPAIAATVTSAARVLLLDIIEDAGRDNVIYTDTDSIFVTANAPGPSSKYYGSNGLGMLKHEKHVTNLVIHGVKDYAIDGVETIKGVRRNAVKLAEGSYKQDMFIGIAGAISDGDISRQVIKSITKRLERTYHKGIVTESGKVIPFRLDAHSQRYLWSQPVVSE